MLKLLRGVSNINKSSATLPNDVKATSETSATKGSDVKPPESHQTAPDSQPSTDATTSESVQPSPTQDAITSDSTPSTSDSPTEGKKEETANGSAEEAASSSKPFPSSEDPATPTPEASSAPAPTSQPPQGVVHRMRRLSFRSFGFFYGRSTVNVATDTEIDAKEGTGEPPESTPEGSSVPTPTVTGKPSLPEHVEKLKKPHRLTKADKRASAYAQLLRSIIVGAPPTPELSYGSSASPPSKFPLIKSQPKPPNLKKLKSELLKPKEANRLIFEVRNMPTPDTSKGVLHGTLRGLNGKIVEQDITVVPSGKMPIHAVCLDCTDEEADRLHFSMLKSSVPPRTTVVSLTPEIAQTDTAGYGPSAAATPSIAQADLASVIPVLRNIKLVDLVAQSVDIVGTPEDDFGFGKPVDEQNKGALAGAVPSSGTVAQGILQVGQELLNLGFATSSAVLPTNHEGIHPPTDRLSCLTYWWGYELVIPPPSMKYLGNCKSISTAFLNFLTAFSLFNNGVREILPFIRYASQFIDFEWTAIKAQDKGKGVVCAATWVMPAALVPRPWDFADPPPPNAKKASGAAAKLAALLHGGKDVPPGTSIILTPLQPSITTPGTQPVPLVTLSPPTVTDAAVGTDDDVKE